MPLCCYVCLLKRRGFIFSLQFSGKLLQTAEKFKLISTKGICLSDKILALFKRTGLIEAIQLTTG